MRNEKVTQILVESLKNWGKWLLFPELRRCKGAVILRKMNKWIFVKCPTSLWSKRPHDSFACFFWQTIPH